MVDGVERRRVTVVMAHAHPTLGMERVALEVAHHLSRDASVRIVVVAGEAPDVPGVSATSLGPATHRAAPLVRWLRLWRARRDLLDESVVVLVGAWLAVPALLVPGMPRRRAVVWEHSLMKEQLATTFMRRLLWRAARLLYRTVPRVVAVSEPLGHDLAAGLGPARVVVIPNPVASDGPATAPPRTRPASRRLVLSVGSLTANKRHHLAIRAVAEVEDCSLEIFGEGPARDSLEGLVRTLGLEGRVHLRGYQPHRDVLAAMASCDVVVHPSAGETFGMVFVEAAAAGVPVLAADNRVSRWMIPTYVPGRTFTDAHELARLLRDGARPSEGERLQAREQRATCFSPSAVTAQWHRLIEGVRGDER